MAGSCSGGGDTAAGDGFWQYWGERYLIAGIIDSVDPHDDNVPPDAPPVHGRLQACAVLCTPATGNHETTNSRLAEGRDNETGVGRSINYSAQLGTDKTHAGSNLLLRDQLSDSCPMRAQFDEVSKAVP